MTALLLPLGLTLATGTASAAGPNDQMDEIDEQATAVAEAARAGTGKKGDKDVLAVPLPITSPVLGVGLVVAGVVFYNPNGAPSPWISGAAAMKTNNDNWLLGGFHSMSLADDRFRFTAAVGAGKLVTDYYGTGDAAGDRDVAAQLDEKTVALRLQPQMRVLPGLYAGVRALAMHVKVNPRDADPAFPDLAIPQDQRNSTLVQFGPAVTYDRRDDSLNPRQGAFLHAEWLWGIKALGSDYKGGKFTAGASVYVPSGTRTVWAFHAGLCDAAGDLPYFDLCLYGQKNDLRGYKAGRYRDGMSWALQAEWRRHLFGRVGMVAFGGIGGIAPSLAQLGRTDFLPAGGVGLRFQPSRATNINLRLDLAVGKDSQAVYLGIAEAF